MVYLFYYYQTFECDRVPLKVKQCHCKLVSIYRGIIRLWAPGWGGEGIDRVVMQNVFSMVLKYTNKHIGVSVIPYIRQRKLTCRCDIRDRQVFGTPWCWQHGGCQLRWDYEGMAPIYIYIYIYIASVIKKDTITTFILRSLNNTDHLNVFFTYCVYTSFHPKLIKRQQWQIFGVIFFMCTSIIVGSIITIANK